ncbi:MAG: CpXC domain-containing protein [Aquabacterium sp.]
MSVFESTQVACPSCGQVQACELVHSVNAVRRPDLRQAILDRQFQRQACVACGASFRVPPRFTYLDLKRRQFIGVFPPEPTDAAADAAHVRDAFERAYGAGTDGAALAADMVPRAVFGWPALTEKLLCGDFGIDDAVLELCKVAALRRAGRVDLRADREWRLIGRDGDQLALGWLDPASEDLSDSIEVPRALVGEIAAAPAAWDGLRAAVTGDTWVDYRRSLA